MNCTRRLKILSTIVALFYLVTAKDDAHQNIQAFVSKPRVVGGRDARPGEIPYQVTIQRKFYFGNGSYHWCGGAIIDGEHVLTAGHCVYGLDTAELIVYSGVLNNTWQSPEASKVVQRVTHAFLHEGFDYEKYHNDIAILKVSPGFPKDNPEVSTIPLREDIAPEALLCSVSGWGLLGYSEGIMPEKLQVVTVPFIRHDRCRLIYENYTEGSVEPGMNCAGYPEGGRDACGGDSGGPLQCGGLLTGIVSWGEECALPDYPGVYADVAFYKDWIAKQLDRSRVADQESTVFVGTSSDIHIQTNENQIPTSYG
ncbi:trypsin-1-like [Zootermopsis nevadensis]|uniref:trypsin-1-like n=1 Tax=Zootermopsis nevadensis TaxID=136037 RepID=UPI000B8E3F5B|nr:trypsin-1-like [Zootermopsis nevadensis]